MTRALHRYLTKPVGEGFPVTTFDQFIATIRPFDAAHLVSGFNLFGWKGWRGEFATETDNGLAVSIAPMLALCGYALGDANPAGGTRATNGDLIDLHSSYLAIDAVHDDTLAAHARELARMAIGTDLALLLPDLQAARSAAACFTLARVLRAQLLPSRSRFDELSRIWWIAQRLDREADQIRTAERILGMEVPVFVRSAMTLLALAVTSDPMGVVVLDRPIEDSFTATFGVDADTLRLAADRLAMSRAEAEAWFMEVRALYPEGIRQYAPSLLSSLPLLRFTHDQMPPLVCPSLYYFVVAVRDRVRDAISQHGGMNVPTVSLYGNYLARYVEAVITGMGAQAIDLDLLEDASTKHADFFVADSDCGIIIEVKRSIAKGLGRYLVSSQGIFDVLTLLRGAYRQCQSTHGRRAWSTACPTVRKLAAVILIDEPVGAEGAAFSELLGSQTIVDLPFEVMSVTEFENALGVLGVRGLTNIIRDKWRTGHRGLPLRDYAIKVRGDESRSVPGVRKHLFSEDQELFLDLGLEHSDFAAEWP